MSDPRVDLVEQLASVNVTLSEVNDRLAGLDHWARTQDRLSGRLVRHARALWGVWLVVVVVTVAGFVSVTGTADDAADTAEALAEVVEETEAQRCVNAWEARDSVRDMVEAGYRRNAETLLSFATNPERAQVYREQVEADVAELRSTLADPDCSLTDAQAVLAGEDWS